MIISAHNFHRYRITVIAAAVCFILAFVYAADTKAEGATVATGEELRQELINQTGEITLGADISTSGTITIGYPVKIINDSYEWTHNGTMIFTNKDYNAVIDNVSKGNGFLVRYRSNIMINGATSSESVVQIKYSDGTEEQGNEADASISEGGMTANLRGKKAASWKDVLNVTGVVTDSGSYVIGTKNPVLSKVYSITYLTTVNGKETVIQDINGAGTYTEDDSTITLPTVSLNGYKFLGWSLTDGSTEYVKEIPAGSKGDLIFYGIFEEDPDQQGGRPGGWGQGSIGGFSGVLSTTTDTVDSSASNITEQVQTDESASGNRRRIATGKSKTAVEFHDGSSGKLDLDGVIQTAQTKDHTKQFLILGIGLVAAAAIGMIALLKKKR